MTRSILDSLARELAALLLPISRAVESPLALNRLLDALGIFERDATSLMGTLTAVRDSATQLEALASQDDLSFETFEAALEASRSAYALVQAIAAAGSPFSEIEGFGRDLVDLLLAAWLGGRHPVARAVAALLTLLEAGEEHEPRPPQVRDDILVRAPFRLDRLRLDRLPGLLRDPVGVLRAEYVNALATDADADAMADRLFPRLVRLLRLLGVSCRYGINPGDEPMLGDAAPLMSHALIVYADDLLVGAEAEAGVVLTLSPASRGDLGLVISPFGSLTFTRQVGRWAIESALTADVDALAWGRHGLTLLASTEDAEVTASVVARAEPGAAGPAFVLGDRDGTRIEIGSVRLGAEITASQARQSLALSAECTDSALVIAPGSSDGFLASFLPKDGLRAEFDLGLAWSSDRGLTLRGSGSLDATLPVNVSVAGVTLSSIHLGLAARDESVQAEVSASLSTSIGPVHAVVDRLGLAGALRFPENGGNLGAADLEFGFKPPSGIGLTIDAGGLVTGGGFLFHDAAQSLYAGAMQLSLKERITVKAFGLVATRMPDGSKGYSLIVFITAEDFQPIPIGMGLTLQGIGGMLAIHRTFNEEAMREGLRNNTLGTLLFPRDPVRNAPEIIRNLATALPARRGSHLFGILVKIGWFSPTLVTLDLALMLEIGARKRLIALGRIQSLLPSRDNALIKLNLDAMGLIDFDEGRVEIDAVLVDSRLVHRFVLTGAMALRARWKSGPGSGFALAVGGFHPRFAPPVNMPRLDRIAIALAAGDNPRLTCEAYFAITSNTLQFGARAQLYAAAIGFSLQGDVGFDVLLQLVPFHFLADFHASVQLKRGSRNLFKVSVAAALEGPRPLRVSGKASFEILWCDFTVRFDKTLVEGERPPLPPAVDVLAELRRALGDAQSWTTQRDEQQQHGVALRKLPPASTALVLDPLGIVTVKQQVVPLNSERDIDRFGGAPVAGARRFQVGATLSGQVTQTADPAHDLFAPAQFFDMSDDEKLASPSFEEMQAGLTFGSDAVSFDDARMVASPLEFETFTIDAPDQPTPPKPPRYVLDAQRLTEHVRQSAVAKAPVRSTGLARFRDAEAPKAASMQRLRWVVVSITDTGIQAAGVSAGAGWSEKRAALAALNRTATQWQLVPEHER